MITVTPTNIAYTDMLTKLYAFLPLHYVRQSFTGVLRTEQMTCVLQNKLKYTVYINALSTIQTF